MKVYEFNAEIKKHGEIDAAFIEFPYNVESEFGKKGQVKVKATFDGYEYRGSLANMGYSCHILGLTKEIRNLIGKQAGDMVHVTLIEDKELRMVQIPDDLNSLLMENPEAKDFFNTLSYTNQKKYVQWIESAKKPETRTDRIIKSIDMLKNKMKKQ